MPGAPVYASADSNVHKARRGLLDLDLVLALVLALDLVLAPDQYTKLRHLLDIVWGPNHYAL